MGYTILGELPSLIGFARILDNIFSFNVDGIRRINRLTNAFSKQLQNRAHMVALYALWCVSPVHKSLRTSPAMAVRVETPLCSIADVTALIDRRGAMRAGILTVGCMRSSKFDTRRQPRNVTLSKKIVAGLLLVAAVIFVALVISGIFR